MSDMSETSGELLGYPRDARLLIVNCDDFGMYPAINAAVIESIEEGIAASCSLMVPCPAAAPTPGSRRPIWTSTVWPTAAATTSWT
ncbi:ChbG/HpnK family deacetylase [Streptomyces sp. NPDC058579]|uniref:ChbG/HpnK family deacetylase n=1 Tax=Streptomyces sp. NPDC058579 TaxID=3346548 RepID=UPI003646A6CF